MKFPYGISDFYEIMTEDYFYVDRTSYIREIEEFGKSLRISRPRRFGKSLLLSTLENYYDVNKADQFERLFGHLAIGQNPTKKHNQHLVMRWDFSSFAFRKQSAIASQEDLAGIKRTLYDHINTRLTIFAEDYEAILDDSIIINPDNAIASFESTMGAVRRSPYRVYLLIDEYDNFANSVLMSGHMASRKRYEGLVKSPCLHGAEGLLKTLLSAVKSATSGFGLDRIFMTGVSPIVMSDITSGHNISEDISRKPPFESLCGFLESDIESALQQLVHACGFEPSVSVFALQMMRLFYDGYSFSFDHDNPLNEFATLAWRVYNPTLALYFLKYYISAPLPPAPQHVRQQPRNGSHEAHHYQSAGEWRTINPRRATRKGASHDSAPCQSLWRGGYTCHRTKNLFPSFAAAPKLTLAILLRHPDLKWK